MVKTPAHELIVYSTDMLFANAMVHLLEQTGQCNVQHCDRDASIPQNADLVLVDADTVAYEGGCPSMVLGSVEHVAHFLKPVHLNEIFPSIQQRLHQKGGATELAEGLWLDTASRQLSFQGEGVTLTEKELGLLLALCEAGGPVQHSQLLEDVWGYKAPSVETNTLETHLYRLRKKLEEIHARHTIANEAEHLQFVEVSV
jgi:hypothetical protein